MSASIERCNNIIDSDLSVEEVEHAIHSLKSGRSGGFDGLSPEHLKFSGPVFRNWLCQIYNQICQLEMIPKCFKHGIIIPAYKGKGRDPLLKNNYRGITLTCVMSKVFEIILKERISPVLDDAGIPQVTQTAYRKGVGCQDSIFAGKESTDSFIQGGDNVFTCFYDLASAFDTVKFSILLEELFRVGIQGKCWRLIHNWHQGLTSQVSLGKKLSQSFSISCGIHQGSVLSPTLFNLVLDPLLSNLRQKRLSLSINGLYLGAFAHADDIRTSATNIEDVSTQIATVDSFTSTRGLQLCQEKCGVLSTCNLHSSDNHLKIGTSYLGFESSIKYLGVWWEYSSSSKISIADRINKACAAFFSRGDLGAFHGLLNPLSSRSLVESCIISVLMYGSESWVVNVTLLKRLESFQAEIGKRILRLPKYTSNNIPLLVLRWPSMCARILCSKISFLFRTCSDDDGSSLRAQTFAAIAATDVNSLSIIKQCRFLQSSFPSLSNLTDEVLCKSWEL